MLNGAENGYLKIGQDMTESFQKSHYGNSHLQIGQTPITVAEHFGLIVLSVLFLLEPIIIDKDINRIEILA